jgi:CheY-like chemotaxis protein
MARLCWAAPWPVPPAQLTYQACNYRIRQGCTPQEDRTVGHEKDRDADAGRAGPTPARPAQVVDPGQQDASLQILLVEDEMLLAMVLEEMVMKAGHTARRATRLSEAMELVRDEPFAAAVLDVNVAGEPVFPLAALLRELGTPFCFATGYGVASLAPEFRDCAVLQKPFGAAAFEHALQSLLHGKPGTQRGEP